MKTKKEVSSKPKKRQEGYQAKVPIAARVEPYKKQLMIEKYGSAQKFIEQKINDEFATPHEAVIVRAKKTPTISINDF